MGQVGGLFSSLSIHVLSRELNISSFSSGSSTLYTRLNGVAFKSLLNACFVKLFFIA